MVLCCFDYSGSRKSYISYRTFCIKEYQDIANLLSRKILNYSRSKDIRSSFFGEDQ